MVKNTPLIPFLSLNRHFALFLKHFMHAIMTYVKQNKWKFFATLIVLGGMFFAFNTFQKKDNEAPELRHRKLLSTVGYLLESEHYSPRKIDDQFSTEVFEAYLKALDPEKNIFLQTDIDSLKIFQKTIDDEIHGAKIQFQPAVSAMYARRYAEVKAIFNEIIKQPFDFSIDDSIQTDADSIGYAVNIEERKIRWHQLVKYKSLERYASLQEDRDQQKKAKPDSVQSKEVKKPIKSDAELEVDARYAIAKSYHKRFEQQDKTFNEEKKFDLFLNAITGLMDPHTDYFAPIEKRSFTEQMSGVIYGIGAQLGADDNGVKIASITPGGPAWKSGQLVLNDVIIKVAQGNEEPVDIAGYEVTDAVKLIRGDLGSEVRLTVRKPDASTKVVVLKREKIILDEGYARSAVITKGKERIGYILLPDFYADFDREDGARCSKDVAKEVEKLKAENVDGIIIDVRYNGGGSLFEVVQMVGLFIDMGPVVQIRDREGRSQVLSDEKPGILYNGPLVVMINEFSASASEIFAGAIQDYKRGIVVGSTSSYGKGTVQRNVAFGKPLDDLGIQTEYGAVKLTFQKFYRVTGSSTQKKGVASDIVFPDEYEFLKYREKDNPSALDWDEIQKARFQPWTSTADVERVILTTKNRIESDTNTIKFKKNAQWVSTQMDRPVYLKLDKYLQYKKKIQSVIQENENILKLKEPMQVAALKADYNKFYNNAEKMKNDRYQAWLKMVAKDIQISESSKIISSLLTKNTFVKNK
jgi:carboxyl-terminal processing protease